MRKAGRSGPTTTREEDRAGLFRQLGQSSPFRRCRTCSGNPRGSAGAALVDAAPAAPRGWPRQARPRHIGARFPYLGNQNNRVAADDVPALLRTMHARITELSGNSPATAEAGEEPAAESEFTPAVTVRKSLASKDHIISMIDGKPYKTLKRHLSGHGLTPSNIASATTSSPIVRWSPRITRPRGARWRTRSGSARRAGKRRLLLPPTYRSADAKAA